MKQAAIKMRLAACMAAVGITWAAAPTVASAQAGKPQDFNGRELVVQSFPGTVAAQFREVSKEFSRRFNAKVTVTEGLSVDAVAKLRAGKGNPEFDVFSVAETWGPVLEREGLLEPLAAANVPALNEISAHAKRKNNAWVNVVRTNMAIAYNTTKFKPADMPKRWADLADPKYKGRLLLPAANNVYAMLLMLKLADTAGGDTENINPGMQALTKIAPNVMTFFTSYDQNFNLLNSGQAWIAVTSADRVIDQITKGAPVGIHIPEDGTAFIPSAMGVSKGTKNKDIAEAYLNFLLSKEVQKSFVDKLGYLPARDDVELPPVVKPSMPVGDSLKRSLLPNWEVVTGKQPAWIERYTKEVAGR